MSTNNQLNVEEKLGIAIALYNSILDDRREREIRDADQLNLEVAIALSEREQQSRENPNPQQLHSAPEELDPEAEVEEEYEEEGEDEVGDEVDHENENLSDEYEDVNSADEGEDMNASDAEDLEENEPVVWINVMPNNVAVTRFATHFTVLPRPNNLTTFQPNRYPITVGVPVGYAPMDYARMAYAPRADAPMANARMAYAPMANAPGADAPMANAPRADAPMANARMAYAPGADAPMANAPRDEARMAYAPRAEARMAYAPRADAPMAYAPGAEARMAYAPRADAPMAYAPGAEARMAYAPRADAPMAYAPGAEARMAYAPMANAPGADARVTPISVTTQQDAPNFGLDERYWDYRQVPVRFYDEYQWPAAAVYNQLVELTIDRGTEDIIEWQEGMCENNRCLICFTNVATRVAVPCGHRLSCRVCLDRVLVTELSNKQYLTRTADGQFIPTPYEIPVRCPICRCIVGLVVVAH